MLPTIISRNKLIEKEVSFTPPSTDLKQSSKTITSHSNLISLHFCFIALLFTFACSYSIDIVIMRFKTTHYKSFSISCSDDYVDAISHALKALNDVKRKLKWSCAPCSATTFDSCVVFFVGFIMIPFGAVCHSSNRFIVCVFISFVGNRLNVELYESIVRMFFIHSYNVFLFRPLPHQLWKKMYI